MISLIVSSMNRTARIKTILPSWINIPEIDDIVIVDWSSKKPMIEDPWVKKYMQEYSKLKIVRVENQKFLYFELSLNLARRFTSDSNKILMKIDADYINLDFSWFDHLNFRLNGEYTRKIKGAELPDCYIVGNNYYGSHTNGFVLVNKYDFDRVGGYNENLLPLWGVSDCDFYDRLEEDNTLEMKDYENVWFKNLKSKKNCYRITFFTIDKYIKHLPHSKTSSFENFNLDLLRKYKNKNIPSFEKMTPFTQASLIQAKIAMENKFWNPMEYKLLKIDLDNRYFVLEPTKDLPN